MPAPVVLASASPRRRELLARLLPEFEVEVADLDEDALTVDDPWQTAVRLAEAKARQVFGRRSEALVIGGDTVVALPEDGGRHRQLAKPASPAEAAEMLRALSGRTHRVITGVALVSASGSRTFAETTLVTFRELSEEEIARYVATGEPMDKAGGYAVQGAAADFVERLEGSETNVIGLPTERLGEALREWQTSS
jgi:septum formation protein